MATTVPHAVDLGLQVRDYLDGSEARQMALRQRIWKDRSARGPVLSKNPFRFPLKAPNGDYSAVVTPGPDGAYSYVPAHLQAFRGSMFAETNTHTVFTQDPPDGEAKPSMKIRSDRSPVKYRGTMLSNTSNRLPAEIMVKQDTRLAHMCAVEIKDILHGGFHTFQFNPPKEYIPGPGEVMWEQALGGQSLGPYYYLTKSSVSRSPGRDPHRPSQPFMAKPRDEPATISKPMVPDTVYSPAAPDYSSWVASGFATTSNLRDIKAETWGRNPREPRDPHAAPGPCAHRYVSIRR